MNRDGRHRLAVALAALIVALLLTGVGAYSTFTGTATSSLSVSTGTVTIALGATGASTNRLNVSATNVAPGDTIQRSVDLINQGTLNLATLTLTTNATVSSLLDTDAANGLQIVIDECSVPWTEAGSSPAFTYTCGGTTASVLASRAVIGSNLTLSNLTSLTAGNTDHLRVTLTLPTSAGNTFQGLSSTIQFNFTGVQRNPTSD
ncbi:MAG: TasA family protein [Solirubrobacteraceae bacterium]